MLQNNEDEEYHDTIKEIPKHPTTKTTRVTRHPVIFSSIYACFKYYFTKFIHCRSCKVYVFIICICICMLQAHNLFRLHDYLWQRQGKEVVSVLLNNKYEPKTKVKVAEKTQHFVRIGGFNSSVVRSDANSGLLNKHHQETVSIVHEGTPEFKVVENTQHSVTSRKSNLLNKHQQETVSIAPGGTPEVKVVENGQYSVKSRKRNASSARGSVTTGLLNKHQQEDVRIVDKTTPLVDVAENTEHLDSIKKKNASTVRGILVLGMHRSGTSLLSGLLVNGLHYKSPGKNLGGNEENPYGFYENWDVVRQNNIWLKGQNKTWDFLNISTSPTNSSLVFNNFSLQLSCARRPCNTEAFILLTEKEKNLYFRHRYQALLHYNDPTNAPWIMKDPRLCVTMSMWLPLLRGPRPAVIFTFRDPLEVARSLGARHVNQVKNVADGLKLWIWYNRLALENSKSLCRVVTSNEAISQNHKEEMLRIHNELVRCGLPSRSMNTTAMDSFFNKEFMHSKETSTKGINLTDCPIPLFQSSLINIMAKKAEEDIYEVAMKVYCDLRSGEALKEDYQWPIVLTDNMS